MIQQACPFTAIMKSATLIVVYIHFFTLLDAQSMKTVFSLLPAKCTPELNPKQKAILLKNKQYTIPGGDSIETVTYSFELDEPKGYIRYEFGFTTGQNGFGIYEVRKFLRNDGTSLIIFSNYSGTSRSYFQSTVLAFNYRQNKLVEIKNNLLPQEIKINQFLKQETPDSIRDKLNAYTSSSYDLHPEYKNKIKFHLFFEISNDEDEKYIIGDTMIFTWTGNSFKQHIAPYPD